MSDIYVPIDVTDTKSVIPPGEDIIYSTMCQGFKVIKSGTKDKIYRWNTHVLLTPNGFAYTKPDFKARKTPLYKVYDLWEEVFGMILTGGKGFKIGGPRGVQLTLMRVISFETKELFEKRIREFLIKFPPIIIEKKEQWLEQNRDNPDIKKKRKKFMISSLSRLNGNYRKILAKEQQKVAKEQQKLAKEQQKLAKKAKKGKKN